MSHKDILKVIKLFNGLDQRHLQEILDSCEVVSYGKGEVIFAENSRNTEMYIVAEGEVTIKMWVPDESEEVQLSKIQQGHLFGELALVDDEPRSATAVASQDVLLIVMTRDQFFKLVEEDPALGIIVLRNLVKILSERLRLTDSRWRHSVFWGGI